MKLTEPRRHSGGSGSGGGGSVGGGGDGSLFLACEDFAGMFDQLLPARAFFILFYFILKVGISSRTLIPRFRPG